VADEVIQVIISPRGEVTIEVSGVEGDRCLDLTRTLEESLSGSVLERRVKNDAGVQTPGRSRESLNEGSR